MQAVDQGRLVTLNQNHAGVRRGTRNDLNVDSLARQAVHLLDTLLQGADIQGVAGTDGKGVAPRAPAPIGLAMTVHHVHGRDQAHIQMDGEHPVLEILRGEADPTRGVAPYKEAGIKDVRNPREPLDTHALPKDRL